MAQGQTLRLYNTLSRSKEDFVPIDPANVRMYVCGPTVYDYAHIGNARPAIVFDLLFRLLRHVYGESHVTYVRNITDVDDKINARAARDFPDVPLNDAIRRLTETTAAQYQKDVTALGCLPPTVQPRATDFVLPRPDGKADMASLIQSLIERGHAYAANDEILFDTASMADYGRLSQRRLEDQQAGARIAVDAHKKNPEDFVLWKGSSAGEPGWPATFRLPEGERTIHGRPGWHIECSAMSAAYLGEVFDIHGGGLDLIFPHHENEIAQSRCAHGTDVMAKVWMHNGFLQVEGKKMSKSEGNFVTIHELLETEKFGGRKWPGEVLRLAMLMTHYREPIDFSVRRLEEAIALSHGWKNAIRRHLPEDGSVVPEVINALKDDLNSPLAIRALANATPADLAASVKFMGLVSDEDFRYARAAREEQKAGIRDAIDRAFERAQLDDLETLGIEHSELQRSVTARLAALNAKNFAEADRIRAELLTQGVQLMDFKDPATGERRTKWELKRR